MANEQKRIVQYVSICIARPLADVDGITLSLMLSGAFIQDSP